VLGLVAVAVIALTISLGNWQARRAAEKSARQALLDARVREAPVALDARAVDASALEWRRVRLEGEIDAAHTMLLDNRVHAGRPGYHVVAPVRLAGSAMHVLVDQGWIPQGRSRAELPPVNPPSGRILIEGQAVVPSARVFELKAEAPQFRAGERTVIQNVLLDRIAQATGLQLLPILVLQTAGPPEGLVRDWPAPAEGIEKHRMYSLQWYSFAALAAVLYVVFLWRRARRKAP
jgi:surfeit locus 1 family protein